MLLQTVLLILVAFLVVIVGVIAYGGFRLKQKLIRLDICEIVMDALIESPKYVPGSDKGFNGQLLRKQIFRELINTCEFNAIVETGTHIGNTTGYLAEVSRLPVYSCELHRRFHLIAKARLSDFKNIHLELSDSQNYLNKLARGELAQQNMFFYLDAHRYCDRDSPLIEEINIIASHWKNFVVMIDDFMVPDDDGYGYDNYGKVLSLKLIGRAIKKYGLIPFFPSFPSTEETGYRRGCVVLAKTGALEKKISRLNSLTRAKGF